MTGASLAEIMGEDGFARPGNRRYSEHAAMANATAIMLRPSQAMST